MATRRVVGEVGDELAVDLEVGDLQALEVGEAAVTDAEVVEGDPASELREHVDETDGCRFVGDERGLGDLEGELIGSGTRAENGGGDEVDHGRVGDRSGADVDLDVVTGGVMRVAWSTTQRSMRPINPTPRLQAGRIRAG